MTIVEAAVALNPGTSWAIYTYLDKPPALIQVDNGSPMVKVPTMDQINTVIKQAKDAEAKRAILKADCRKVVQDANSSTDQKVASLIVLLDFDLSS